MLSIFVIGDTPNEARVPSYGSKITVCAHKMASVFPENRSRRCPVAFDKDCICFWQENLKMKPEIDSFFSLTEDSTTPTSTTPAIMHQDLPASCSNCQKSLIDGATVYQRKGHADIFCSSSCLLNFFQKKQAKKTCYFCLQWGIC